MPTHQSFAFLHIVLKLSFVRVVHQQTAFIECEIPLAEAVAALVLFAHVSYDNWVRGGRCVERLHCPLVFGAAGDSMLR